MDEQERKARGKAAIERYYKRQEPKTQRKSVHNEKPEKEVEKACLAWMREQGWTVAIYESKATYNAQAGRYISQNMKAGTADCMGSMGDGIGVVVEFKAPGKLSTFASEKNHRQQEFIKKKIDSGCFACVVDSVDRLKNYFYEWISYRASDAMTDPRGSHSKQYLHAMLPKRKRTKKDDDPLF